MTENADTTADADVPATDTTDEAVAAERTFTQTDLDRIVKDRLARQKAQYQDYDEIKGRLSEIEQASKSELEKAQEKAAEFEKRMEENDARAREALLRAAVVSESAKKRVVNPDAAFKLLDMSLLEFDEQGQPSNVAAALDSLLADMPFLAGTRTTGSADLGAREGGSPGQLARDDLKTMTSAQIVQAQTDGRLRDLMRGDT